MPSNGMSLGVAANQARGLGSQIGSEGQAVSRISHGVVHAIKSSGMRHDVEGKIQRPTSDGVSTCMTRESCLRADRSCIHRSGTSVGIRLRPSPP